MKRQERIRMLRIQAGLTQDELAGALHITKQTVHKYETGLITNIPLDKIEAMAALFHVAPAYIAGWDETEGAPANMADAYRAQLERLGVVQPDGSIDQGKLSALQAIIKATEGFFGNDAQEEQ